MEMAVGGLGCDEKCLMFDELHWWHWQVGAAPWEDFFIGGAHPSPSINFLGENPRSNLYGYTCQWICCRHCFGTSDIL
jgi:hypothetical protein